MNPHFLFVAASTRQSGHLGNTEWLARQAAAHLPTSTVQTWLHLSQLHLPPFVDMRHTLGEYPAPQGDMKTLLDATVACTNLVLVAPVYWYSMPSTLKTYIDHWSAWMRVPGLPFKEAMAKKRMHLVCTGGNREKAQPMIDSIQLCAAFLSMDYAGELWGKGGPPDAVKADAQAALAAQRFFAS